MEKIRAAGMRRRKAREKMKVASEVYTFDRLGGLQDNERRLLSAAIKPPHTRKMSAKNAHILIVCILAQNATCRFVRASTSRPIDRQTLLSSYKIFVFIF